MKKFGVVLVLWMIISGTVFAVETLSDELQWLAMQMASIGTIAKGGMYILGDQQNYSGRVFPTMQGGTRLAAPLHGAGFQYAQAACDYISTNKSHYEGLGMQKDGWYIAATQSSSRQISLYDPGSRGKAAVIRNGVPGKEYTRKNVEAHGGATDHAWLWVYGKDNTIYWLDPAWTDDNGYVWWGTVEGGKEVRRNPPSRLNVTKTSHNTNAVDYFTTGNANLKRGLLTQAIEDYTQAIRGDHTFGPAYYNRGIAYDRKKNYRRAIADYTEAIKYYPKYVDPAYVDLYSKRGNAYYNNGDWTRAIEDWTQVTRLAPNYVDIYYNRGKAYLQRGKECFLNKEDYDRAIEDLSLTIQLAPTNVSAYNNRGTAYYYKRDYDHARADWTKASQLDPKNAAARENLERCREQHK
jgi:Flp pilus assembly protein TadD